MRHRHPAVLLSSLVIAACGGVGTGPSPTGPLCSQPTAVDLAPSASRFIDVLRETSCLTLAGGAVEREYLVVLYSAEGQESTLGVEGSFGMRTSPADVPDPVTTATVSSATDPLGIPAWSDRPGGAAAFHRMLRQREGELARSPLAALSRTAGRLRSPRAVPELGEKDTFNVCRTTSCSAFDRVGATVRVVGEHAVIYVDDAASSSGPALTESDLAQLGGLFDDELYPIDTTAFGRESDIDGDERIAILISRAVNALTTDCSDGRVVGYFFGGDLLFNYPGSNQREVFYTLAPADAAGNCPSISRASALRQLPPVLIHELQHMISFNEHVLKRGGREETLWLNEGLSHYAEELGFRALDDAQCPNSTTCFSEFMGGNLFNGYEYLEEPEATHLIAPGNAGGPLAERGAAWLFVTWLSDHFAADTLRGTQLMRSLVRTGATGEQNVAAATGVSFATLLGEWQLANYLEDLPGYPQSGRLRYRSFDLRGTYSRNSPQLFPRPYPLVPPTTSGTINRTGTLRGGSGAHLLVTVPAGSPGITVRMNGASDVTRVSAALDPRIAVVRIR